MGKYFGTDGFRGEVNTVLKAEHAYQIGRFLGWYYSKLKNDKARTVIGKDTRRSGYMLENALCSGITSSGADAYIMHVTPTPSVAYITRIDEFDCGIMISASHNPFCDNGIKLLNKKGEKMEEEVISLVEAYLDHHLHVFDQDYEEIPYAVGEQIGRCIDYVSGRDRYVAYLISLGTYSLNDLSIGLDCANGATFLIAKPLFEALGAKVYAIHNEPDGININKGAGSTHPEALQKFVVENHLDVGFAFDGDADRCLAVDQYGNLINGDQILYLYAKYMKDKGTLVNNEIVTTIMSNIGLYKAFDQLGISYHATPVGDKNVYEYMSQHQNLLGGEQSGHIIFSKYATTGDGMLTAIKVLEAMKGQKKSLFELVKDCQMFPQVLVNVKVSDKKTVLEDKDVQLAIEKGMKELGHQGRVLVRESGTEPLIRVMVEAETLELCNKYCKDIVSVIENKGYEVK